MVYEMSWPAIAQKINPLHLGNNMFFLLAAHSGQTLQFLPPPVVKTPYQQQRRRSTLMTVWGADTKTFKRFKTLKTMKPACRTTIFKRISNLYYFRGENSRIRRCGCAAVLTASMCGEGGGWCHWICENVVNEVLCVFQSQTASHSLVSAADGAVKISLCLWSCLWKRLGCDMFVAEKKSVFLFDVSSLPSPCEEEEEVRTVTDELSSDPSACCL